MSNETPYPVEFESDIRFWYANHKHSCPTCRMDLRTLHPEANLMPHFSETCKPELFVLTREDIEKAAKEIWFRFEATFPDLAGTSEMNLYKPLAAIILKHAKPAK